MRQAAAARFFPRQMLVKKFDFVARARKLFTAHCAGRSAADDCYLGHGSVSLRLSIPFPGGGMPVISSIGDGSLGEGKDHQAKASEEYSTEKRRCCRRTGFFADDVHGAPLQDVKESQVNGQQADKNFSVVQN